MLWWCERVVARDVVWAGDAAFLTLGRDVKSVDGNHKIFNQNRNILWIRNKISLSLLKDSRRSFWEKLQSEFMMPNKRQV